MTFDLHEGHHHLTPCAPSALALPSYQISSIIQVGHTVPEKCSGQKITDGGRRTPHRHLDYQVSPELSSSETKIIYHLQSNEQPCPLRAQAAMLNMQSLIRTTNYF